MVSALTTGGLGYRLQPAPTRADNRPMARLSLTQAVSKLGTSPVVAVQADGIEMELTPLSHEGTRLTATADRLRVGSCDLMVARVPGGDLLDFSGRFFATVVTAEVRVARVAPVDDQLQVGCTFSSIAAADRRKLREVTAVRPSGEAASFSLLQHIAAERAAREAEPRGL